MATTSTLLLVLAGILALTAARVVFDDPARALTVTDTVPAPFHTATHRQRTRRPTTLIVGGQAAKITEVPWQVAVQAAILEGHSNPTWETVCGGSIIGSWWVLTAAHCYSTELTPQNYRVRAGSANKNSGGNLRYVGAIVINPHYAPAPKLWNDIALFKTTAEFDFRPSIKPIRLSQQGLLTNPGTIATMSGWGQINATIVSPPTFLRIVYIPVISRAQCQRAYNKKEITDTMLCAANATAFSGICTGDSGGPMVVANTLVGVTSWVKPGTCGDPAYPSVFTRVSAFTDWIKTVMVTQHK